MRIDAVGVSSSDMPKTAAFYTLLGFEFPEIESDMDHVEPIAPEGGTRLMLDSDALATDLIGEKPRPSNHSHFAILYDTPAQVDEVTAAVGEAGYTVVKEPWDAFWGQRYAVVQDPDGYQVDLFAAL